MKIEKIYVSLGWYNPFTDKVVECTTVDFYDKERALEWIKKEKEDSEDFRVIKCFKSVSEWFVADDENFEWVDADIKTMMDNIPEEVL